MPGRMTKLGRDETGITVEGEDYKDFLARKEEKEKEDEAEAERKKEIGTKTKHKKKVRPRERFEDDPARVSKRVRHLSPFEIRKEYGVKERPFPTLNQNVLFTLFNAGDALINSRAISVEIGKPLADTSSALSHIWNKLKDTGMIYRKRVGLAYQYCMTNDALELGFEPLFRKFWKISPAKTRGERIEAGERRGPYAHGALLYKRTSKNIIDLIARTMAEEFIAREIAEGVGKPPANISSTLQMVIKRLQPHGMIELMGSRATRSYKLHNALAQCTGEDLIEFIQSHKKHYDKPRDQAWAFWDKRLTTQPGLEPEEPEPLTVEDPRLAGAYRHLMERTESMFKRIEALEEDGLDEKVVSIEAWLGKIAKRVNGLKHEIGTYRQGLEDNLEDKARAINPTAGEGKFDLNINVRFLLR